MNFKANESTQKLTGSYYTPAWIADFVARWVAAHKPQSILEPSCGDGVFFESLLKYLNPADLILRGFDIDAVAVEKTLSRDSLKKASAEIKCGDYLDWAIQNVSSTTPQKFDAIVGNPPFIRYQYLEKEQQDNAQKLFSLMGMKFTKHTNAWIPFVLSSISFLNPDGILGMVIPSEILHVLYAQGLREYLLKECSHILLIDPEDLWFEDTLQGAMLLMAQKKHHLNENANVAIIRTKGKEFALSDPEELFRTVNYIDGSVLQRKWTYALLTKEEFEAYSRVIHSKHVYPFSQLADVDVGIVTGANKFFLVPDNTIQEYGLSDIAHPMFGRSEHCPGVVYDDIQHKKNAEKGYPTNFLYFVDETAGDRHSDYIALGEAQDIHLRYKCKIRKPWYKVPSVFASSVSMLKRSNGMPRLILNKLNAYTTDTAYRISPKSGFAPDLLVFSFLNTLTALSAELEGRFYGGGVLELVPSEIERLAVPYFNGIVPDLEMLNDAVQTCSQDDVLYRQDKAIYEKIPDVNIEDIKCLSAALQRLRLRRQRIADFDSEEN